MICFYKKYFNQKRLVSERFEMTYVFYTSLLYVNQLNQDFSLAFRFSPLFIKKYLNVECILLDDMQVYEIFEK